MQRDGDDPKKKPTEKGASQKAEAEAEANVRAGYDEIKSRRIFIDESDDESDDELSDIDDDAPSKPKVKSAKAPVVKKSETQEKKLPGKIAHPNAIKDLFGARSQSISTPPLSTTSTTIPQQQADLGEPEVIIGDVSGKFLRDKERDEKVEQEQQASVGEKSKTLPGKGKVSHSDALRNLFAARSQSIAEKKLDNGNVASQDTSLTQTSATQPVATSKEAFIVPDAPAMPQQQIDRNEPEIIIGSVSDEFLRQKEREGQAERDKLIAAQAQSVRQPLVGDGLPQQEQHQSIDEAAPALQQYSEDDKRKFTVWLFDAINNDAETWINEHYLPSGLSLNVQNDEGVSSLVAAITHGNASIVEMILPYYADQKDTADLGKWAGELAEYYKADKIKYEQYKKISGMLNNEIVDIDVMSGDFVRADDGEVEYDYSDQLGSEEPSIFPADNAEDKESEIIYSPAPLEESKAEREINEIEKSIELADKAAAEQAAASAAVDRTVLEFYQTDKIFIDNMKEFIKILENTGFEKGISKSRQQEYQKFIKPYEELSKLKLLAGSNDTHPTAETLLSDMLTPDFEARKFLIRQVVTNYDDMAKFFKGLKEDSKTMKKQKNAMKFLNGQLKRSNGLRGSPSSGKSALLSDPLSYLIQVPQRSGRFELFAKGLSSQNEAAKVEISKQRNKIQSYLKETNARMHAKEAERDLQAITLPIINVLTSTLKSMKESSRKTMSPILNDLMQKMLSAKTLNEVKSLLSHSKDQLDLLPIKKVGAKAAARKLIHQYLETIEKKIPSDKTNIHDQSSHVNEEQDSEAIQNDKQPVHGLSGGPAVSGASFHDEPSPPPPLPLKLEQNAAKAEKLLMLAHDRLNICKSLMMEMDRSSESYNNLVEKYSNITEEIDELEDEVILSDEQELIYDRETHAADSILKRANLRKQNVVEEVKVNQTDFLIDMVALLKSIDSQSQNDFIQQEIINSSQMQEVIAQSKLAVFLGELNKTDAEKIPLDIRNKFLAALDAYILIENRVPKPSDSIAVTPAPQSFEAAQSSQPLPPDSLAKNRIPPPIPWKFAEEYRTKNPGVNIVFDKFSEIPRPADAKSQTLPNPVVADNVIPEDVQPISTQSAGVPSSVSSVPNDPNAPPLLSAGAEAFAQWRQANNLPPLVNPETEHKTSDIHIAQETPVSQPLDVVQDSQQLPPAPLSIKDQFLNMMTNMLGEDKSRGLHYIFSKNEVLINHFISHGEINVKGFESFIKDLKLMSTGEEVEIKLREMGINRLDPSSLKQLRIEVAKYGYTQPFIEIPQARRELEKDRIQEEVKRSHLGRLADSDSVLDEEINSIGANVPAVLLSLTEAVESLKQNSDPEMRDSDWQRYADSMNTVIQAYDRLSDLAGNLKSEYNEKINATHSAEARLQLKASFEPLIEKVKKLEIKIYNEMDSAEFIELRERENDKRRLEIRLASLPADAEVERNEIKLQLQSIIEQIENLPEALRKDYAAKTIIHPTQRAKVAVVAPPVIVSPDIEILRGAASLLQSVREEIRAEYIFNFFENNMDKIINLKKIENEWFSEQDSSISLEQRVMLAKAVNDILLGKVFSPDMQEEPSVAATHKNLSEKKAAQSQILRGINLPDQEVVISLQSYRFRQPAPEKTTRTVKNYPEARESHAEKSTIEQTKNGFYLLWDAREISDWNGLFENTPIDMRYLQNILRSGHLDDTVKNFMDSLSEDKLSEIIETMSDYNELIGVLGALPPGYREGFLIRVPQNKLEDIITNSLQMSLYIKGLYDLKLGAVVEQMDREWIKSTVQNAHDIGTILNFIPAPKQDAILDLFLDDYLADKVTGADELFAAVAVLVQHGKTDQVHKINNNIPQDLVRNETDLSLVFSTRGRSIAEKNYYVSMLNSQHLKSIADNIVNADRMVDAMSMMPANRLDELIAYMGEPWLKEVLSNVEDINISSSFLDRLPAELHTKFLNIVSIKAEQKSITLSNIKNADDFFAIAHQLEKIHGKDGLFSMLNDKMIRSIFNSIHDTKQLSEFFEILPDNFKLSEYLTSQNQLIESITGHRDFIRMLSALRDNSKKEDFLSLVRPDVYKKMAKDMFEVNDIVTMLGVLPSEKSRATFLSESGVLNQFNDEINTIYSLAKLQNFEKVLSRLAAENQPFSVYDKKLPTTEILVLDMNKMLSDATPEARKKAISTMATIIRKDDHIRALYLNIDDLSKDEIKILATALAKREQNGCPAITELNLQGGGDCDLATIHEFLVAIKPSIANRGILTVKYDMPRNESDNIDYEVEQYINQKVNLEKGQAYALPSMPATESALRADNAIKQEFAYLSGIKFPDEQKRLFSELNKLMSERSKLVLTAENTVTPVVRNLTVKIPETPVEDSEEMSAQLSSTMSSLASEIDSPLTASSPSSVASSTQESQVSPQLLNSDTNFHILSTERGSTGDSPRQFEYDNADADAGRIHSEVLSLCTEYDEKYKNSNGQINDIQQLALLAELMKYINNAGGEDALARIHKTLKSIRHLDLNALQGQINEMNRTEVLQEIVDVIRGNKNITQVDLPITSFSASELKTITTVLTEAEPSERIEKLTLTRVDNNPATEGVELARPILEQLAETSVTKKPVVAIVNAYPLNKLGLGSFLTEQGKELAELAKKFKDIVVFDEVTNNKVGGNKLAAHTPMMFKGQELARHNKLDPLTYANAPGKKR